MGKQSGSGSATQVHLSTVDMRRMAKPRAGFEKFGSQLIALAEKKPALRTKGFDAKAAMAELATLQSLDSNIVEAEKQLALAKETRFYHASNLWVLFTSIYARGQLEAKDDVDVEYALRAFVAFMKKPRKSSGASSTPSPASSTTPSTGSSSSSTE